MVSRSLEYGMGEVSTEEARRTLPANDGAPRSDPTHEARGKSLFQSRTMGEKGKWFGTTDNRPAIG